MTAVTSARARKDIAPPRWQQRLFAPVDIASIVVFRIAFGAILLVEVYRWLTLGWLRDFTAPFHFTYHGFEWLPRLPPLAMVALVIALGILALLVMVGWHYRLAMALFCVGFTYIMLLDKALYLNHFYLVALVSFALVFVPAESALSLDARRKPSVASDIVPAWALWLLRLQIAIPYFYGGVAKFGSDWLHGQPMQMRMEQMTHIQAVVPWFGEHWLAMVFSYGGLLLDLCVVPLLLYRPTRAVAFAIAVAFHLCNAWMFSIGIFPWFMIAATTLFLSPAWPRRLWRWPAMKAPSASSFVWPIGGRISAVVLVLFLLVQLVQPLRHWAWGTQVDWTEEGSRFAWRMMLNEKLAAMQLVAIDATTRERIPLEPAALLTPRQIDKMSHDPEMLREFSHFAGRALAAQRGTPIEVHAVVYCALNGRRPQLLIDPAVDLAQQARSWLPATYIVPLTEPLPDKAYVVPPSEWQREFQIDIAWPPNTRSPDR